MTSTVVSSIPAQRAASPLDLLTIEEVADHLRVPVSSLRYWRSLDRGPKAARIGKHLRYRRSEVERWVDAQVATDTP